MNIVDTIRDPDMVKRIKHEAELMGREPGLLVLLGLNTGLRISDILTLKVGDFRDRGYILRREQKTGKHTEIRIDPAVVAQVVRQTKDMESSRLLFPKRRITSKQPHLDRTTAYDWINEACRRAGYKGPVGCHTLRKTYGYHFYRKYKDLSLLMMHFNHANERVTMRYIGLTQDTLNEKTTNFRL